MTTNSLKRDRLFWSFHTHR